MAVSVSNSFNTANAIGARATSLVNQLRQQSTPDPELLNQVNEAYREWAAELRRVALATGEVYNGIVGAQGTPEPPVPPPFNPDPFGPPPAAAAPPAATEPTTSNPPTLPTAPTPPRGSVMALAASGVFVPQPAGPDPAPPAAAPPAPAPAPPAAVNPKLALAGVTA